MSKQLIKKEINKIIKQALKEDGALNDVTSNLTIPKNSNLKFSITPREEIIFCGHDVILESFAILKKSKKFSEAKLDLKILAKDGDIIKKLSPIATGISDARMLLAVERTLLNLIQLLSGVATSTKLFIDKLDDANITILDTRKTLPNYRVLQKYAVTVGGAKNHRFNLSDMILIKDNHIAESGSVEKAILLAKKTKKKLKIEVECDNLDQVSKAIKLSPDVIMLDNMTISEIKEAISIINKKCKIEVSGGVSLETIQKYKGLEIDFISVGSITNSPKSVDIGLDILQK